MDLTGVLLLIDGKSEPHEVRLRLSKDVLTIQHQDVLCISEGQNNSKERTVTLHRQDVGGFGLSIKVPSLWSKTHRGVFAQILHVSIVFLLSQVQVLRNAGDEVTLTVIYLKKIPAFLKLPLIEETPSSPSSPVTAGPRWEKRWMDSHSLHLLLARISSYIPSTDQLRPNAFEVVAMDGVSSGVLQCCSMHECGEWLEAVSQSNNCGFDNINNNVNVHMGWVEERLPDPDLGQCYQPRFLALKGPNVYIFHSPPLILHDWSRGERTYDLCETFLKVHKDTELRDLRPYCFGILTGTGDTHYLSVELPSDTCVLERAYQKAQFAEVQRVVSKTYSCIWHGHGSLLSIDFNLGFTCLDASTKVTLIFKFCQLKGSSDDSKTKIKFLFQKSDARLIEAKELEFPNLVAVLHCIHTFISAKVALVDPIFVENQSATKTSAFGKS
uniref:Syntrophin, gamma 2 n=1 Tax=Eptatretus burgeri TaxID=7764 RepID=A0A8C4Q6S0_EPTBU